MANQVLIYTAGRVFFAALGAIMGEVCTLVLFYFCINFTMLCPDTVIIISSNKKINEVLHQ